MVSVDMEKVPVPAVVLLVFVVLETVVLVQVTLTVVQVAVTIMISGGTTYNEDSTISSPCNWKFDSKNVVRLYES